MSNTPYGSHTYPDPLENLRKLIDDAIKDRARYTKPIDGSAEEAHREVLGRIREFFEDQSIERRVLCKPTPLMDSVGCTLKLEDGKRHVLVREDIARFFSDNDEYQAFKEYNSGKKVRPQDFFMNVVAHEYGHILLAEKIVPRLIYQIAYSEQALELMPSELDEAFAFFFGDEMTGLNSPLEELSIGYRRNGIDFDKTISLYNELRRLNKESRKKVLEVQRLKELALRCPSKPEFAIGSSFSVEYQDSALTLDFKIKRR